MRIKDVLVVSIVTFFFFSFELNWKEINRGCTVDSPNVLLYQKDSLQVIYDSTSYNVYLFLGQYVGVLGNFKNTFNIEPEVTVTYYDPDFIYVCVSSIFFDVGKRFSDVSIYTIVPKKNEVNEVAYVESVGLHDTDADDLSTEGNYIVRVENKLVVVIEEYVTIYGSVRKSVFNIRKVPFKNRRVWFFRLLRTK